MRKHRGASVLIALAALLLTAPNAWALEEIGNPCVADDTEAGVTMIGLSNQGSEPFMQPVVPPEHKFVITGWRVQVGPGIGPIAQQLVASDQVGEEDDRKVGESAIETLVTGSNEFPTRIPVSEYDHIGLHGPEQTLICQQNMNTAGRVSDPFSIGETRHFEVLVHVGVPVIARVERDADGDGYGDETQDRCPTSAVYQGDCPAVTLTANGKARKRSILVRVSASAEASVAVLGQVGWNFQPKRKPKPGKGKTTRLIIALSGGTKTVLPGATTRFSVPLPKTVLRRLGRLEPSESLKAKITVLATHPAGATASRRLTVKLRGQNRDA